MCGWLVGLTHEMESPKGCRSVARGFAGGGGVGLHFLGLVVVPKGSVIIGLYLCLLVMGMVIGNFFGWIVQINVEDLGLKMKCMT